MSIVRVNGWENNMSLKKQNIIINALELLNEEGVEGVTLRKLANRIGVQAPALYWHFKNKKALVNEMAEEILQMEFQNFEERKSNDETWQDWLLNMFRRLRKALLSHTDGGRVVAGAHLSLMMADFSELTIHTLVNRGVSLRQARIIVLTATRFTFGHVIEEQTKITEEEIQRFHHDSLHQAYPTVEAGIEEYFSDGKTVNDLYDDGLRLIIR